MAIITQKLPFGSYVWGKGKAMLFTRLVKQDIIRRGLGGWSETVQQVRTPRDPQTPLQIAYRSTTRFLAQTWATLYFGYKNSWAYYPAPEATPLFLRCNMCNLALLKNDQPLTQGYNWEAEAEPYELADLTLTPGPGCVTFAARVADTTWEYDSCWGVMLYRSTNAVTAPFFSQLITILPVTPNEPFSWVDSPLTRGTYHYRARPFGRAPLWGALSADQPVTVS